MGQCQPGKGTRTRSEGAGERHGAADASEGRDAASARRRRPKGAVHDERRGVEGDVSLPFGALRGQRRGRQGDRDAAWGSGLVAIEAPFDIGLRRRPFCPRPHSGDSGPRARRCVRPWPKSGESRSLATPPPATRTRTVVSSTGPRAVRPCLQMVIASPADASAHATGPERATEATGSCRAGPLSSAAASADSVGAEAGRFSARAMRDHPS